LEAWLREVPAGRLVIVECGAGTAIPSVRHFCEGSARSHRATLIRINPQEPTTPAGHIDLAMPAQKALLAIDEEIRRLQVTPGRACCPGRGRPPRRGGR